MKKWLFLISLLILSVLFTWGYYKSENLLTAAVDADAEAVLVNGTDFESKGAALGFEQIGALTVVFNRATGEGSASTLDIDLEVSYDGGATWATFRSNDEPDKALIRIATNQAATESADSLDTVRLIKILYLKGTSHIRVKSITNNDATYNLTGVQITLSL